MDSGWRPCSATVGVRQNNGYHYSFKVFIDESAKLPVNLVSTKGYDTYIFSNGTDFTAT
jgi:hypothetical protein